ncbi:MAG: hypothetical protein CL843_16260 [Crocinitomicaceae bacterium]|nr:hypothetical protein [Crocinitomicaceae bacterium]
MSFAVNAAKLANRVQNYMTNTPKVAGYSLLGNRGDKTKCTNKKSPKNHKKPENTIKMAN